MRELSISIWASLQNIAPVMPIVCSNAHCFRGHYLGHYCKKSLALILGAGYSGHVAANSAIGFDRLNSKRRTQRRYKQAFFFACTLWRPVRGKRLRLPVSFLAGLSTRVLAATQSIDSDCGSSKTQKGATKMLTLSLPLPARIKRDRIQSHKAMAYAALHADSSLKVRLERYNHHMNKARAIAGGAL